MKEALYYENKEDNIVQCHLCPHNCLLNEGKFGNCCVRHNKEGKLYSMVYGKASSVAIDPIEKKPLFHFHPGAKILSWGTIGCNLHCKHCQNWTTSQAKPGEYHEEEVSPKELIKLALENDCHSISATYNEPTVFYENMFDTFKLAKKSGLQTVSVSNGFINEKPLKELLPYLDAINVDLKFFDEKHYREISSARLEPVLNTLKTINKSKTWLEITNLIIPTLNDDLKEIKKMCKWILDNLGDHVPLHFSAFYPTYKLNNLEPTSEGILIKARELSLKTGLKYVFMGNVKTEEGENTYCPKCKKPVIKRGSFSISENNLEGSKCKFCKEKIDGVF